LCIQLCIQPAAQHVLGPALSINFRFFIHFLVSALDAFFLMTFEFSEPPFAAMWPAQPIAQFAAQRTAQLVTYSGDLERTPHL
jgi:hypothetical protein